MENLVRKHLVDATVQGNYITGYLESEDGHNNHMTEIDIITGGFVTKWSDKGEDPGIVL